MSRKKQSEIVENMRNSQHERPESFTLDIVESNVRRTGDYEWEIDLHDSVCRFYLTDEDVAIIYHLIVPKHLEGRGIGTLMIKTAENVVRSQSSAKYLHTSIGTSNGATRHILKNKCGFNILGIDTRDGIGEVVKAEKVLE